MKINTSDIDKRKSQILLEKAVQKTSQNINDEIDKEILNKLLKYVRENPKIK